MNVACKTRGAKIMNRCMLAFFCFAGCAAPIPTHNLAQIEARNVLTQESKGDEYPGGIYAQARLDGIAYRPILLRAINLDENALGELFEMNFMGEGGETHCGNLLQLMILWGDARFSCVLSKQPSKTKERVIGLIDYAWSEPTWTAYPKTLALSPKKAVTRTNAASQQHASSYLMDKGSGQDARATIRSAGLYVRPHPA